MLMQELEVKMQGETVAAEDRVPESIVPEEEIGRKLY